MLSLSRKSFILENSSAFIPILALQHVRMLLNVWQKVLQHQLVVLSGLLVPQIGLQLGSQCLKESGPEGETKLLI